MDKRTILALILAGLIITFYPYYITLITPPQRTEVNNLQPLPNVAISQETHRDTEVPLRKDTIFATADKPGTPAFRINNEKETMVETEKYRLVFTNIGGVIKKIYLKEFKDSLQQSMLLVEAINPEEGLFNITSNQVPLSPDAVYSLKQERNAILYTFEKPGDFSIAKKYILSNDKYGIDLELTVDNLTNQTKEATLCVVGASRIVKDSLGDSRFTELSSMLDGIIKRENLGQLKKGKIIRSGRISWVDMKNKYFSLVFKPKDNPSRIFYNSLSDNGLLLGAEIDLKLEPYTSQPKQFTFYAGPTKLETLKEFNLEDTINFGKLDWIGKILLKSLKFFFNIVKNYGLAIIVLTILIYFLLYPLTLKSLKTMKQMQLLQPHMARLKEEYKSNPQKLNKEIMELYRKNKVNPFSGCLPMILQMPVFIALYNVLSRSIELKGAKFLWIKDLSMPDAFLKLPFTLPFLGNLINLLPILMLVAMVWQQKLSTPKGAPQDEQQKMMALMMPIMFGVIFYNLPSGLVLYWLTNTAIMILNQEFVLKKMQLIES